MGSVKQQSGLFCVPEGASFPSVPTKCWMSMVVGVVLEYCTAGAKAQHIGKGGLVM